MKLIRRKRAQIFDDVLVNKIKDLSMLVYSNKILFGWYILCMYTFTNHVRFSFKMRNCFSVDATSYVWDFSHIICARFWCRKNTENIAGIKIRHSDSGPILFDNLHIIFTLALFESIPVQYL